MTKLRALSLVALASLVCALVSVGCSGGSSTTSITLSPASAQSLNPGQTLTITAAVANDTNNQGVTWSLSGPGTLSGNTITTVVYTAPSSVSVNTTATITATSVANTTITATESITINAVLTITTTSLPAGAQFVPYSAFVNAAGASTPFTWTVTSGSLPPGLTFLASSSSTSAQISGTPTVLGTFNFTVQVSDTTGTSVSQALSITINRPPPLSVATGSLPNGTVGIAYSQTLQASSGVEPYTWSYTGTLPVGMNLANNGVISGTPIASGTSNFTVQVTDSSKPTAQTASANLSITINPGFTNNSRLSGNYAFSVRGFDPNGLFVAAGSFFADGNGNISTGLMDENNTASGGFPVNETFNGTYSIDSSGLGIVTFNVTAGGSRTFALSMMANGNGNIIEFDDSNGTGTRNSGVLLKQNTSAFSTPQITGAYAFGFVGIDSGKNRFGMAGDFQADGAGHFTSGLLDSDDAISGPSPNVAFTGTYSVASNGRGLATITTVQGTTNYSFYVVNGSELLAIEIDPFSPGAVPLVSGSILQQTSNSGFNATSVFEVTGVSGLISESQIGLFNAITQTFTVVSDQNTGGALTSPAGSGAYSIANGRVSLSGSGFQNSPPVLYMVNDNHAFIIGTDSAVSFGFMTPQSPPPFSNASLSGTYAGGSLAPVEPGVSNAVSIAIAGPGTIDVTADVSSANGLSQNQAFEGISSISAQTGRVVVSGSVPEILYLVSPAEFVALSQDAGARVDIFAQ